MQGGRREDPDAKQKYQSSFHDQLSGRAARHLKISAERPLTLEALLRAPDLPRAGFRGPELAL